MTNVQYFLPSVLFGGGPTTALWLDCGLVAVVAVCTQRYLIDSVLVWLCLWVQGCG
jgi:hypothetical protein